MKEISTIFIRTVGMRTWCFLQRWKQLICLVKRTLSICFVLSMTSSASTCSMSSSENTNKYFVLKSIAIKLGIPDSKAFFNENDSRNPCKVKYEDDAHKEKVGFCGNRKFMIHQSDLGKILDRLPRFKKGDHFVIEITGRLRKQQNITLSELQRSQPNILVKRPKEKLKIFHCSWGPEVLRFHQFRMFNFFKRLDTEMLIKDFLPDSAMTSKLPTQE